MKNLNILRGLLLVGALLAAPAITAAGTPSRVLVIHDLKVRDASAVVSASESLVWNRKTGLAVAEIPASLLPGVQSVLRGKKVSLEGNKTFGATLSLFMPEYHRTRGAERGSGGDFAVKAPASITKSKAAVLAMAAVRREKTAASGNCLSEDFEDFNLPIWYENGGDWWHYQDGDANDTGDYFWTDWDCDAYSGSWSADSVLGGDLGQSMQCGQTYDYNTDSWMEYAPWITCAAGVPEASLDFYTTLKTEANYDLFYYVASVDGSNYEGYTLSGDWSDTWYWVHQDLRHWYSLGDLTSYSHFAIAFVFQSDNVVNTGFGVRVDLITLSTTEMAAVASADVTWGKIPLDVHFNAAVQGGTPPYTYRWDFGDGSPLSSEQNPVHNYTVAGNYSVGLTVQDTDGRSSSGGLEIQANEPVVPVVTKMKNKRRPFRIVVKGNNLEKGIKVYIEGNLWPKVHWKSTAKIVLAGKRSLKAAVPKGVLTHFLFENPDGSVTTYGFTR